ncbi:hypothetical protein Calag_0769 [Caldisphaera lagunensis DSM 15908]|uniref:Uncharacterized protein n=2 Tax=Caldisphaera lagunensis TaxID=200415 RepID=L0ABK6_CALLD|nr:hypothetical protein Calag_0769 [Caldisphaera lagunensis DSM 15908]
MEVVSQKYVGSLFNGNVDLLNFLNQNVDLDVYVDRHAWSLLRGQLSKIGFSVEMTRKPKKMYIYISIEKGNVSLELRDHDKPIYKETISMEKFKEIFK